MRKWLVVPVAATMLFQVLPAHAAVKAATVARVGDQCLRDGKVAPGRAIDGTDLVCMKAPIGSSKGELLWWYNKITPLKIFEIISPIISRNSDSAEVIASRSADRIGASIGMSLKSEELVKEFSSKNFSGGSGTWALSTFQAYKNRLATSFIGSQSLINGLITTKSNLKLLNSKAIAQLVQEYEAIAVPSNSKYTTLDQLVNDLRANPKSVTFIGSQAGGVDHTFMALIFNQLNIDPASGAYLPQNSGFDVVNKVMTDKSFVALSTSGDFVAQANTGKLRVLGVAAPEKLAWIKAKTLQQQNLNLVYGNWYGIFVPPQLSNADTSNFIHILDIFQNSKQWQKTLSDNFWSPGYLGQKEFVEKIEQQTGETRQLLQQLGF
jgi:putative tricarboxylic transport membrane protein